MEGVNDRKIAFINQAAGYLTIDIINAFAAHYDQVALIAGSLRAQDIPLDPKVKWSRIAMYDRGHPCKKFFSWTIGTLHIFFLLVTKYRKYELFYITNPPFAYLLSLILPNKFSVLVFDVYPDALKSYNMKETSWLYKLWKAWNKKLFAKAHRIYTLSEGMARLLEVYTKRDRLVVIPNWAGLTGIGSVEKNENPWIKEHGFKNKFIVQYSGNMGASQNVETLLEVARELKNRPDILFVIIGRGERAGRIQELIKMQGLANCVLLPFQPDPLLKYSLAAADLGVVILDENVAHVSVPSKIYNLMAVGAPLMGIAPPGSELSLLTQKYGNGKTFRKDDVAGMVEFILDLNKNSQKLDCLRQKSLEAARDFTRRNAKRYLEEHLRAL